MQNLDMHDYYTTKPTSQNNGLKRVKCCRMQMSPLEVRPVLQGDKDSFISARSIRSAKLSIINAFAYFRILKFAYAMLK